jgi:replicative DNA helicase
VEAEQAVLGGLMLAPEAYDRVNDQLTERTSTVATTR